MPSELKERWQIWYELTDVPPDAFDRWLEDSDRRYHCRFCGQHWPGGKAPLVCTRCGGVAGIEPCIPGYCYRGLVK